MKYEIRITGSGSNEDLAAALRTLADDIAQGGHAETVELRGECEWEDDTLMTVISEL